MIIKKFTGKTEKEATDAAKKELGDGIVIMNVRNVKKKGLAGIFGAKQTEVTVALEEEKETLVAEKKSAGNAQNIEKRLDSLENLLVNRFQQDEAARSESVRSESVKQGRGSCRGKRRKGTGKAGAYRAGTVFKAAVSYHAGKRSG